VVVVIFKLLPFNGGGNHINGGGNHKSIEQLNKLVVRLYSEQQTDRTAAYDAIMSEFKTNPNTVSVLLDYAATNTQHANGVYNTVVTLRGLSPAVTRPRKAEINRFCDQAERVGDRTKSQCDALRRWLEQ
jgi:hypothetical protein